MHRAEARGRGQDHEIDVAGEHLLVGVEPDEAAVGGDVEPLAQAALLQVRLRVLELVRIAQAVAGLRVEVGLDADGAADRVAQQGLHLVDERVDRAGRRPTSRFEQAAEVLDQRGIVRVGATAE